MAAGVVCAWETAHALGFDQGKMAFREVSVLAFVPKFCLFIFCSQDNKVVRRRFAQEKSSVYKITGLNYQQDYRCVGSLPERHARKDFGAAILRWMSVLICQKQFYHCA